MASDAVSRGDPVSCDDMGRDDGRDGGRKRKGRRGPLAALVSPDFRTVWLTISLAQTGFWLSTVALQWHVAQRTESDPFALGLLYFINLIPLLLISPLAGILIDRLNRARIAMCTTLSLAAVAAIGGVAHILVPDINLVFTFALAGAFGCLLAVQGPTIQTLLPMTLPADLMRSGVALASTSSNAARIVGPALAGPMLIWFDAGLVILAYAAVMLLASFTIGTLRHRPLAKVTPRLSRGSDGGFLAGVAAARNIPFVWSAILLTAVTSLFGSAYISTLPVLATTIVGGNATALSILLASSGVGAIVGALCNGAFSRDFGLRPVSLCMILLAVCLVALSQASTLLAMAVACGITATVNITVVNSLNVLVQTAVGDEYRGRVMSLFFVAWGGFLPIGGLMLGAISSIFTMPIALLVSASLLAVVSTGYLSRGFWKGR